MSERAYSSDGWEQFLELLGQALVRLTEAVAVELKAAEEEREP